MGFISPKILTAGIGDQLRLAAVELRKETTQIGDLGQIVEGDIGLLGVQRRIILMIPFRRIECRERLDLGHDRSREDLRRVELGDISRRDLFLLLVGEEYLRTILCPRVRPLPVEFGRVVRD